MPGQSLWNGNSKLDKEIRLKRYKQFPYWTKPAVTETRPETGYQDVVIDVSSCKKSNASSCARKVERMEVTNSAQLLKEMQQQLPQTMLKNNKILCPIEIQVFGLLNLHAVTNRVFI